MIKRTVERLSDGKIFEIKTKFIAGEGWRGFFEIDGLKISRKMYFTTDRNFYIKISCFKFDFKIID